jgi:hypothetical protein
LGRQTGNIVSFLRWFQHVDIRLRALIGEMMHDVDGNFVQQF